MAKQQKFLDYLLYVSAASGCIAYGFRHYQELNDEDKQKERLKPLNDEMMDQVIDILSEVDIDRNKKLRFDFKICKESLDFDISGHFNYKTRMIGMPTYFEFKDETADDLIQKYRDKFPKLANLDLSECKKLLVLDTEELTYAIFDQIFRTLYDFQIIETMAIMFSGYLSLSMIKALGRKNLSIEPKIALFLVFAIILIKLFYTLKPKALDYYATMRLIETNDIHLMESGLKYLNKRIQIEQLRGNDVSLLKKQFEKIKLAHESLKERGVDEETKKLNDKSKVELAKKTLAEKYTPLKSDAII